MHKQQLLCLDECKQDAKTKMKTSCLHFWIFPEGRHYTSRPFNTLMIQRYKRQDKASNADLKFNQLRVKTLRRIQ